METQGDTNKTRGKRIKKIGTPSLPGVPPLPGIPGDHANRPREGSFRRPSLAELAAAPLPSPETPRTAVWQSRGHGGGGSGRVALGRAGAPRGTLKPDEV